MTVSKPLLRVQNISFYKDHHAILQNISFDIAPNEVISLIGPNGAGKSTLVKIMLGLLAPTDGNIVYGTKSISYVPQKFSITKTLPLRVCDLLAQAKKSTLTNAQKQSLMDTLDLGELMHTQVDNLSGGQLQRTLLGRALLENPKLLVLDEPMQGLDPTSQQRLYALIDALPPFLRCAMLVVSHDLHWVMKGTKRVICLNKHICCMGTPTQIASHDEFIRLFGKAFDDAMDDVRLKNQMPYIHHHHHCTHKTQGIA